jgi:hypothetical protein
MQAKLFLGDFLVISCVNRSTLLGCTTCYLKYVAPPFFSEPRFQLFHDFFLTELFHDLGDQLCNL